MPVINSLAELQSEMTEWRHDLHHNAQTAYEEVFASGLVQQKLTEWGVPFKDGYAKTGVVATIEGQKTDSGKAIALRADLDALNIHEETGLPYASKNEGKMHACGHDGHTATLLGVAKYLNKNKSFNGKVHLIFQPAEEGGNGAHKMIAEGLFKEFPCDHIFGLHNWPGAPAGKILMRTGPLMASVDEFHVKIQGKGGHAAMPDNTVDPVVVASHIVTALQTITSRNIDPVDTVVVSVTNLNSGTGAFNIIPDTATLHGTVRTFNNDTRHFVKDRMDAICSKIAEAFGATAVLDYEFQTDATVNTADGVVMASAAAEEIVGAENVDVNCDPSMGGEDFGAFLVEKPGAFIFVGQGVEGDGGDKRPHCSYGLHNPHYDFNDNILPIGASLFVRIVEKNMPL